MLQRFPKAWLLYGAAVAALAFSATAVTRSQPKYERTEPLGAVTTAPYEAKIAAIGSIEPSSRTIIVAPDLDGLIASISVRPGQKIEIGDELFALDDRTYSAEFDRADAHFQRAEAEIILRKAQARAAHMKAEASRTRAANLRNSVVRFRPLVPEAKSAEEFDKLVADADAAAFQYQSARGNTAAANAAVQTAIKDAAIARAERDAAAANLDRTVLRSPINGAVLSIDARVGEPVRRSERSISSISVGNIDTLHLRVEIDETQASRYSTGAPATAYVRGHADTPINLEFVSLDPILKPKSSYQNLSVERQDIRVLEVRYRISSSAPPSLFVGQILDVYVEAAPSTTASTKRLRAPANLSDASSLYQKTARL